VPRSPAYGLLAPAGLESVIDWERHEADRGSDRARVFAAACRYGSESSPGVAVDERWPTVGSSGLVEPSWVWRQDYSCEQSVRRSTGSRISTVLTGAPDTRDMSCTTVSLGEGGRNRTHARGSVQGGSRSVSAHEGWRTAA
jgi:hypothetical protein